MVQNPPVSKISKEPIPIDVLLRIDHISFIHAYGVMMNTIIINHTLITGF
jgi:hypothetical protein